MCLSLLRFIPGLNPVSSNVRRRRHDTCVRSWCPPPYGMVGMAGLAGMVGAWTSNHWSMVSSIRLFVAVSSPFTRHSSPVSLYLCTSRRKCLSLAVSSLAVSSLAVSSGRIYWAPPTRSRGMRRSSPPCLRNTLPAVCCGLMPTPSGGGRRVCVCVIVCVCV